MFIGSSDSLCGGLVIPIGVGTKQKVGRLRYMASAVARAYNGGVGAEPPAGSRGRAPGQGAKPPEAESFFAF